MLKLDTRKIILNKGDLLTKTHLPKKMTKKLAYETGVQIGDGCLCSFKRRKMNKKICEQAAEIDN